MTEGPLKYRPKLPRFFPPRKFNIQTFIAICVLSRVCRVIFYLVIWLVCLFWTPLVAMRWQVFHFQLSSRYMLQKNFKDRSIKIKKSVLLFALNTENVRNLLFQRLLLLPYFIYLGVLCLQKKKMLKFMSLTLSSFLSKKKNHRILTLEG